MDFPQENFNHSGSGCLMSIDNGLDSPKYIPLTERRAFGFWHDEPPKWRSFLNFRLLVPEDDFPGPRFVFTGAESFWGIYNKIPWFVSNIWCLELMSFSEIFFEDPQNSMKRDKIQVIATEWRRKFPRLRGMPCPADIYSTYMQEDDSDEASAGERASVMKRCQTGVKNQETELAWVRKRRCP